MIVRTGSWLVALIGLVVLLSAVVLSTSTGNRLIVNWAENFMAPALRVEGLSGSLLSSLCARAVSYETSTVSVLVEDICVAPELWTSIDFLTVQLQSLEAVRVAIETRPDSDQTKPTLLSLPVGIAADELILDELWVNGFVIRQINTAVQLSDSNLVIAGFLSYEAWRAEIATSGSWARFRVEMDVLNVRADATLNLLDKQLPWTLSAASSAFDLAPFAERNITLSDLKLSGSGNLEGYEFETKTQVKDPEITGWVRGSGTGDWQGMTLATLGVEEAVLVALPVEVQQLSGRGRLSWADSFSAAFSDIDMQGRVSGNPLEVVLDQLSVDTESLSLSSATGRLLNRPEGVLKLDGRLEFSGPLNFDLVGEGVSIGVVDERVQGIADLQASVKGSLSRPELDTRFTVASLGWDGQAVGGLEGDLRGSLDSGALSLRIESAQGVLDTGLDYSFADDELTLSIARALLAYQPENATAELQAPATVVVRRGEVHLAETCFELRSERAEVAPGQLCGTLDYPDGGVSLHLEPWRMPVIPLPDGQVSVAGVAAMDINVATFVPLVGEVDLRLSELSAHHPDMDPLSLGGLLAQVSLAEGLAKIDLATPDGRTQELLLNGSLTSTLGEPLAASVVDGSLYMELDGIWVAESLLPMDITYELDRVRGVMGIRAGLSGTLEAPILDGTLKLSDAGWHVLASNTGFTEFALDASLIGSEAIAFQSSGMIGGGRLEVAGNLKGMSGADPRLRTDFTLKQAAVLNLPDYSAVVDGDFSLEMGREDLLLTGDLQLTEADILIADLPETAVTASADVIIVDEQAAVTSQQLRTTDVRLTLGDDVRLEAFGLSTRLSGDLRLEEAPGRLRSVTGIINLHEGKFEAYGQELVVERGQLTFTGRVEDPTVDLIATRTVNYEERDYRISLVITGTARDLQTDVRSQPSLPEDDALALLLTGQTFSQISSSEQSNVYGAALSMGLLSATGVTQNLASALNLEEIILDQDSSGNMEVGAAVRLNRDIYLRYTYGVFSRLGGVLLRYRLSRRFSVQAKTGDAHSIEVRYGVDD